MDEATSCVALAMGVSEDTLIDSFSPATEADIDAVVDLRKRLIGRWIDWDDLAYLRWRYRFGRVRQGWGECWVMRHGGRVIALIGTEELILRTRDGEVNAVRVMDLLVDVDYRKIGLTIWILMRIAHVHEAVLTLGSNANSRKLVGKLFKRLPDRIRCVANLRLAVPLRRRCPAIPAWLAETLAAPVDLALHCWRQGLHFRRSATHVAREPVIPAEAQALHDSDSQASCVDVVRTLQHWRWRLRSPRLKGHDIWCVRKDGVLMGMVIVRHDAPEDNAKTWSVLDVVLRPGREEHTLRALLQGLFAQAWREEVTHLHWILHRRDITRVLMAWGFADRSDDFCTMSLNVRNSLLRDAAARQWDWRIGEIHMDSD